MQASIYCTKCKSKEQVKHAEILFLSSNNSTYVCQSCKVRIKNG